MKIIKLFFFIFFNFAIAQEDQNPYSNLEKILPYDDFGFFCNENQLMLEKIIKEKKVLIVVELGAFLGKSTRFIAKCLPDNGKVYAVDHWKGNKEHQNPQRLDVYYKLPFLYEQFLSNVIYEGLCEKIIPVKMTTLQAAESLNLYPDLIYVDASHDFDSVMAVEVLKKYKNI